MRTRRFLSIIGFALLSAFLLVPAPNGNSEIEIPGLTGEVQVITDKQGVRHLVAENDFDLVRAQGFVHCRDRFFQMDVARRQVDGVRGWSPGETNS